MSNQFNLNFPSLTKRRFVNIFRTFSRISFWVQLILGIGAGATLLLVMLSNNFSKYISKYLKLDTSTFLGNQIKQYSYNVQPNLNQKLFPKHDGFYHSFAAYYSSYAVRKGFAYFFLPKQD